MKEQLIKKITYKVVKYVPEIVCEACRGHGKEICNNPDHGGIESGLFGEDNRIGCPVCGHDPYHRTKYDCESCLGTCFQRPITIEDILIAVVALQGDVHINLIRKWHLGKPLHEQPVETLEFIRDILK